MNNTRRHRQSSCEMWYWGLAKVKVKSPFARLSTAPLHEDVLGSGCVALRILILGIRWRWMVSFTL